MEYKPEKKPTSQSKKLLQYMQRVHEKLQQGDKEGARALLDKY